MDDVTKNAVREEMLRFQSIWLERGEKDRHDDNVTGFTIARVIADAFATAANEYKVADPNRVGIDTEKDLAFLHDA